MTDRIISESASVDMGGGISAVTVTTIPDIEWVDARYCAGCHQAFEVRRAGAKYCSGRCRARAWRARHEKLLTNSYIILADHAKGG